MPAVSLDENEKKTKFLMSECPLVRERFELNFYALELFSFKILRCQMQSR